MFSAHCAGCGTEVLLTTRRIVRFENTDRGIVVVFRCWRGHRSVWVTGKAAEDDRVAVPAGSRQAHDRLAPVAS